MSQHFYLREQRITEVCYRIERCTKLALEIVLNIRGEEKVSHRPMKKYNTRFDEIVLIDGSDFQQIRASCFYSNASFDTNLFQFLITHRVYRAFNSVLSTVLVEKGKCHQCERLIKLECHEHDLSRLFTIDRIYPLQHGHEIFFKGWWKRVESLLEETDRIVIGQTPQ